MTEGPGAKGAPHPFTDEERTRGQDVFGLGERERRAVLAWVGENLTQVRRSAYEQRLLHWSLGIGFVVGLAAHVGGYLLRSSATTEPLGLVADLLYALGWALWTGAVVVVFVPLHWTLPRPRTPEQADRFTWAVAAGYAQLRLARTIVTDLRLPWEQPLAPDQLTPERVRRRFRAVLAAVGTPASAPKPHGRSPGRPRGTLRGPAPRYPAIKLTA